MSTRFVRRLTALLAGIALAVGLVVASAPQAEAASVWDKVAKCESGGNWKISTGNGYYGGLQFSARTWKAFGGKKYASSAHKATKSEQIAVARRVLASQGAGAWPTCGRKAGLTKSNGGASRTATPTSTVSKSSAKKSAAKKSSAKKSSAKKSTAKKSTAKKSSAKKKAATYVKVKRGDTLAKIARRHHVSGGWKKVWKLNRSKLANPNRITIGQSLRIA